MINILKKLFFQNSQILQETAEKKEQEQIEQKREYIVTMLESEKRLFLYEELKKVFRDEAKIIKIEAAQKILNSNLLDKINNQGDKND